METETALALGAGLAGLAGTIVGLVKWWLQNNIEAAARAKEQKATMTVTAADAVGNVVDTIREMLDSERAALHAERAAHTDCLRQVTELQREGRRRDSDISALKRKVQRMSGESTDQFATLRPSVGLEAETNERPESTGEEEI